VRCRRSRSSSSRYHEVNKKEVSRMQWIHSMAWRTALMVGVIGISVDWGDCLTYPDEVRWGRLLQNSASSTVHTAPFTFSTLMKHLCRERLWRTAFYMKKPNVLLNCYTLYVSTLHDRWIDGNKFIIRPRTVAFTTNYSWANDHVCVSQWLLMSIFTKEVTYWQLNLLCFT